MMLKVTHLTMNHVAHAAALKILILRVMSAIHLYGSCVGLVSDAN